MTRVLFIGNSYTFQNSLPAMVQALAQAQVPALPFETESILSGGATLRWHLAQESTSRRIREGGWHHVVLQEQSLLGGLSIDGVPYVGEPEDLFFPAARRLSAEITSAGARPLFYMTWSRKPDLAAQDALTRAYVHIANELDAPLASVGAAWERVRRERPELELYDEDGSHPSPTGSYLAACVLFATIFHRSCEGAPSTLRGAPWTGWDFDSSRTVTLVTLPEDTARYLQRVGSDVGLAARPAELPPTTPPHPPLPTLPEGEPLQPARLVGPWSGALSLYPVDRGMSPATFFLRFTAQGSGLAGRARLTFSHGGSAETAVTPQVQGNELSFSIQDPAFLEATVQFRAVLKNLALHGVASAEDSQGGRWHGSWWLSPAE